MSKLTAYTLEIYKKDRLYLLKLAAANSGHHLGKSEMRKASEIANNEEVWPIIEGYLREVPDDASC